MKIHGPDSFCKSLQESISAKNYRKKPGIAGIAFLHCNNILFERLSLLQFSFLQYGPAWEESIKAWQGVVDLP